MMDSIPRHLDAIARDGYTIVPAVIDESGLDTMIAALESALARPEAGFSLLTRGNGVYGARNVLELWPQAATAWRQHPLPGLLRALLGPRYGLVRVLFFDKHEETWSLPWHKDMTVAVREHRPSARFGKPTVKAGVPHLEAPLELLESMLILRLHLDDVTPANGPMVVLPGSHKTGKQLVVDESRRVSIEVERGAVLAIRPLVAHASLSSQSGHRGHRRVLHFEFAAWPEPGDGLAWHTFSAG